MVLTKRQPAGSDDREFFGLPVDHDPLFSSLKNTRRKSVEKRQARLVKKIAFIKPFSQSGAD